MSLSPFIFFEVKKGLLFEPFVLSFLVIQIAHKNILTSIFKLPFCFEKNVITKRWKIMCNLVEKNFNFMESHVWKNINTKAQKLQFMLRLMCTKLDFLIDLNVHC
jgi:hypothetical protein